MAKHGNSKYSKEMADQICKLVREGANLHRICQLEGMPAQSTIYGWLQEHEYFSKNYAHAREDRADARVENIDAIVDDLMQGKITSDVARVVIDTYKWQAGKEKPKKYGEKIHNEHSGAIAVEKIERVIVDSKDSNTKGLPSVT